MPSTVVTEIVYNLFMEFPVNVKVNAIDLYRCVQYDHFYSAEHC